MAPIPTPNPAPAPVTGKTKKWWMIHVAAGVVMVALVAIGVTQCSGKKAERAEKEAKESELATANADADSLRNQVQEMYVQIGDLQSDNTAKSDTIAMQCDSIATLNDSLLIVNEELTDCRNSKRKPTKPAPVKPAPVKPAPVAPVNTPAVQAAVDTLNNITVKRTIYIECTVEREY